MERKMTYYLKRHDYLLLSFVALFVTVWLTTFQKSALTTVQIIWFLSLTFVGWSLVHHFFDRSLKTEVMIEYLVTVGLVMVILLSFLQ